MTALRGSLLVLAAGTVFSLSGLAFRVTDDVTAWQFVIFRGLGATIATTVMLAWRHRGNYGSLLGRTQPSHYLAGLLLGAMSTIFIVALEHASVAFVLFLQTLAPLAAAYFSWLLLREQVSKAVLLATIVSLVGVTVMVSGTFTDAIEPLGVIAVFIPLAFGLYATLIRRADEIDPQVPVWIAGVTLVLVGMVAVVILDHGAPSIRDAAIGMFAGSMLLAIPVSVMNIGARAIPAPETSLLLMSEVVLAPLWVWIFVSERPELTTLIGGMIILGAVLGLLLWRRNRTTSRVPVNQLDSVTG